MKTIILQVIFACLILTPNLLKSQLCEECDLACIDCSSIDGLSAANGSSSGATGPGIFCTIVQHQITWIGFIAGSSNLSIGVQVDSCTGHSLEVGIFGGQDCDDFELLSNCYGGTNGNAIPAGGYEVVTATEELVPGQYYWLIFDQTGNPPGQCYFTLSIEDGSTGAPSIDEAPALDGPIYLCDGDSHTFDPELVFGASEYEWTLDGDLVANDIEYEFEETTLGSYTLCARPLSYCEDGPESCTEIFVGESYDTTYFLEICKDDCIEFEGELFCDEDYESFEYQTVFGCDSIIQLELNLYNEENEVYLGDYTICDGGVFYVIDLEYIEENELWLEDEDELDEPGNYFVEAYDIHNCLYFLQFDLDITDTDTTSFEIDICSGEFILFQGDTLTETGEYCQLIESPNGCDSLTIINLSVGPVYEMNLTEQTCGQDTFMIGDSLITEPGIYEVILQSEFGCDSLVELFVEASDTIIEESFVSVCEGESYFFIDSLLTQEGQYNKLIQTPGFCDSLFIVNLDINENSSRYFFESICEGDSLFFVDNFYSIDSLYEFVLPNSENCDSLVQLELEVVQEVIADYTFEICNGDTINIGNDFFTIAGDYQSYSQSESGCDSITNISIDVIEVLTSFDRIEICEGDSILYNSVYYSKADSYEIKLISENNCDSIVTLELEVNPESFIALNVELCDGELYDFGGDDISSSGYYENNLTNQSGCDSTIALDILFYENAIVEIDTIICSGETIDFFGQVIDSEGEYTERLSTVNNCDSTIILNLELREIFSTELRDTVCQSQYILFNGDSITQEGLYTSILQTESGCDSVVNLEAFFEDCSMQFTYSHINNLCSGDELGSIELSIQNAIYPVTINWTSLATSLSGNRILIDESELIEIEFLPAGNYRVELIDGLGLNYDFNLEIEEPDPIIIESILSDYNAYNIRCYGDSDGQINIDVNGGMPGYNIIWSDGNSEFLRQELGAGTYYLTVEDANGCSDEMSVSLIEPAILDMDVVINTLDPCEEGAIEVIANSEGGTGNISVGIFSSDNQQVPNSNFEVGMYTVEAVDENGCNQTFEFTVEQVDELELLLAPDQLVAQGDEFVIYGASNFEIETFEWIDYYFNGELSCYDCDEPVATIYEPGYLILNAYSIEGCWATDSIFFDVIVPDKVYIPNIFSPGSGDQNASLNIYSNKSIDVLSFQIFSRWGELLFDQPSSDLNNRQSGWDGTINNQLAAPGVYVYKIVYLNEDGEEEILAGDVTIVR